MKRLLSMLCIGIVLFVSLLIPWKSRSAQAEPRCFPSVTGIDHCIDERFSTFWQQQGGLPIFGYPLSGAFQESTERGTITVQWFERVRLEYHPEHVQPYTIELSHLGRKLGPAPSPPEIARDGCLFFAQTGQNICSPFLDVWRSAGLDFGMAGISESESLALFGLPLTPARPETLSDGQTYTVQWFERARFEDHGSQGVMLGLLGRESLGLEKNTGAWVNPYGPQPPGGFIGVSGSDLTLNGTSIRIKGVNYYPKGLPWVEMWSQWNGPQMEQELRLARDQLGINTVRILVPYGVSGEGIVDDGLIERLRNMSQIAADLDLRLIVTLFDFYENFPEPGSREEQKNISYLRRLVGNFVGDERVFAWDIHNEPDHYDVWTKKGKSGQVLTWLGRMADELHAIAPHHLVTVGMAKYENLLKPGPDGRRVIDYSDVVSVHIYNPPDAARQLDEIRSQTSKPILVEEFGWPSGPPCSQADYTEQQQAQVYREVLQAAEERTVGVVAWTLRDYDAGPTMRWDSREEYFGLYRADDTLKPAAEILRLYAAPPLPSISQTNYPHITEKPRRPSGERAPIFIEESGHYIKGWFRRAWDNLGGRGTFGLPLSEAFVRPEDGGVVQYFEAAVLELHEEAYYRAGFDARPTPDQAMQMITALPIGLQYVQGRNVPPPTWTALPNTRYFPDSGYSTQGDFWSLYENLLGPWRFGSAISDEVQEQLDGKNFSVQYFQYGRIERDPTTGFVQPGQLGTWAWGKRCGM